MIIIHQEKMLKKCKNSVLKGSIPLYNLHLGFRGNLVLYLVPALDKDNFSLGQGIRSAFKVWLNPVKSGFIHQEQRQAETSPDILFLCLILFLFNDIVKFHTEVL